MASGSLPPKKRTLSLSSTSSEEDISYSGSGAARQHDHQAHFKVPRLSTSHQQQPQYSAPAAVGPVEGSSGYGSSGSLNRRESRDSVTTSESGGLTSEEDSSDHEAGDVPTPDRAFSGRQHNNKSSFEEATSLQAARTEDKAQPQIYSSFAQKMMQRMGHKAGTGLGKAGQGIVEPVKASTQKGRRGLGLILAGLESASIKWDPSAEYVSVEETVTWIPECTEPAPTRNELFSWIKEGRRKETIDNETRFCDDEVLQGVLRAKTVFDQLKPNELMQSRSRANPFEAIRGGIFLNRAAMKMANIDAVCGFLFTGQKYVPDNRPLYFADVCAGPGGFSEYVLWRRKWRAKGFGFTLKGKHDFKREDFFAGPPETFDTHYGVGGNDGDGNVFSTENQEAFQKYVLENTDKGVHFMMADGGFSVEGKENIQEILSKQLYLCQCLVALSILRPGGHFVVKLFDIFTPFSVGLIYLMYRSFRKISIHKPNTSRPANSERYLICHSMRDDDAPRLVKEMLSAVNMRLNELDFRLSGDTSSAVDVTELVPNSVLSGDRNFIEYIVDSNNVLGERQIIALTKVAAFCQDSTLTETRHGILKEQCLEYWEVPNEARTAPRFADPKQKALSLFGPSWNETSLMGVLASQAKELKTSDDFKHNIRSKFDWKFMLCSEQGSEWNSSGNQGISKPTIFFGLGGNKIYVLSDLKTGGRPIWMKLDESKAKFELPTGTLFLGELVTEYKGEGRGVRRSAAVHIIDLFFINGEDLMTKDLKTRNAMAKLFCDNLNKPSRPDHTPLRRKTLFSLESLAEILNTFVMRSIKNKSGPQLTYNMDCCPKYFIPGTLLAFKVVKEPFTMAFSSKAQRKYVFNKQTNVSSFEFPHEAFLSATAAFKARVTTKIADAQILLSTMD